MRKKAEVGVGGRVRAAVSRWYGTTSVCGLSHAREAGAAGQTCQALAWLVIFVVACVLTTVQVSGVVADFFRYPVNTKVVIQHEHTVAFPAVAVCNTNRIHCGNLAEAVRKRDDLFASNRSLADDVDFKEELNMLHVLLVIACDKDATEEKVVAALQMFNSSTDWDEMEDNSTMSMSWTEYMSEYFVDAYSTLGMDTRVEIGHQLRDLVRSCIFKAYNCLGQSYSTFSVWNFAGYGNCFIFNTNYNYADDRRGGQRKVSMTGNYYGLQLVLDLERDSYMFGGLTETVGARVVVFPPDVNVMPDEFGFSVGPNQEVDVALTHRRFLRQAEPYQSRCVAGWDETRFGGGGYAVTNSSVYSIQQCQRMCVLSKLIDDCGCVSADLAYDMNRFALALRTEEMVTCKMSPPAGEARLENHHCVKRVLNDFDTGRYHCEECRVACSESSYGPVISSYQWPAIKYARKALENYMDLNDTSPMSDDEVQLAQNGLVKISIYFQSLNTEVTEETPKYTFSTFTADLGGALSLMLGISIVMLLEFVKLGSEVATAVILH